VNCCINNTLSALAICSLSAGSLAAINHNAATDFSATSNANGVWSFGYQYPTLGTGFNLATANGSFLGFDYWSPSGNQGNFANPSAIHNATSSLIFFGGSAELDAGQLALHPGQLGEYSIARFTAAVTGTYSFSAGFIGQDRVIGTTSDVHLLLNGAALFSGNINGYHNTASSGTFVRVLGVGHTIDVAVGLGSNGHYYGDTTGIDFNVYIVPTPGAATLLGACSMLATRRRRR